MVQWGAPNTGYYANVPGGQIQCQPRLVVNQGAVTSDLDPFESMMRVGDARMTCKSRVIGVPRPGYMASFRASFARNFAAGDVRVGFIQTLAAGTRVAIYGTGVNRMKLWRNPAPIGRGLLDCGTRDKPWFQGNSQRLPPATPAGGSPPALVDCGDNPRWSVPDTLKSPRSDVLLPLVSVELQNSFVLFAVAKVNTTFYPICRACWETDISWQSPSTLVARVTNSQRWGPPTPQDLLITDAGARTANETLLDEIAHV
ncbi:MAG TPA: hypothetical protein VFW98_12660 [Gemmatimonadaceae bacterium]|nr:hypothetical protein [Gemmatimonadaceae bacterium]